jgi:predicted DNA-binding transcriptional regulator AlpA
VEVHIEGLEDLVREVVREEIAASRAAEQEGEWLDSRQAAAYAGLSVSTIHNLVSKGKLPRCGEKGYASVCAARTSTATSRSEAGDERTG